MPRRIPNTRSAAASESAGTARVRTSNVHTKYCALCRDTYNKPPVLPRQSCVPSSRMRRAAAAGSTGLSRYDAAKALKARSVMTELAYLEKVDPSRRMMRFYAIWIAPTLFGEWAMVREWGRVGSPGRLRESWFATEKIANQAGLTLKKRKQARGYKTLV